MATVLKEVDVVVVGMGFAGSIMARALTNAGLKVVGFERGRVRDTVPDFQSPAIHDELRYSIRKALMQDNVREPMSLRHSPKDVALPIRRWNAFLPGTGLGGSGVHWNGQTWRFQESDFVQKTRMAERYGKNFVDPELTIQDWGVTYKEIEPYYDQFEYLCGTSGKAGNLNGKIMPGGNPLESFRSREYPTPPQKEAYGGALFRKAAESLGYHPFIQPSSNLSEPYTNPDGIRLQSCMYCGFCERYACEHYAKSTPQTTILPVLLKKSNFELRAQCKVLKVNQDAEKKRATGVNYVDASGREFEQPAAMVVVTTFALNNVRMLLLSGIGKPYDPSTAEGVVGRNYSYQTCGDVNIFYDEDVNINPFMASGAIGTPIDDFSADNFDHGPLGFIGGSYIMSALTNGRPIETRPYPPGTPKWGQAWKEATKRHYNHTAHILVHGSSQPTRANYLDLDPTYRDAWGQPLLRMTFDFPKNDLKMSKYCVDRATEIGRHMGGKLVSANYRSAPFDVTKYQTTHNVGGTCMGADPGISVVNPYLQSWDLHNLFVVGASNFQHNSSYNPTATVAALAFRSAETIINKYLKKPGPLV